MCVCVSVHACLCFTQQMYSRCQYGQPRVLNIHDWSVLATSYLQSMCTLFFHAASSSALMGW